MDLAAAPVRVGPTDDATAADLLARVRAALDGSGPAVAPVPADAPRQEDVAEDAAGTGQPAPARPQDDDADPVVLAVATSGSTGRARRVLLPRSALLASATATHARLAGPGTWVLALPLVHVAGLAVLVRSAVAGTRPVVVAGSFDPRRFADAVARAARAADGPLYTSLVPTQLHRLVEGLAGPAADDPGAPAALAALRRLDAVLLGGAAAAPALLERARAAGLRVVTTYGMTETCGGCVYDGVPLDGVRVDLADDGGDDRDEAPDGAHPGTTTGTIRLGGPVLARGYADGDDAAFTTDPDGARWFRTSDLGSVTDGRLAVLGRVDDVLVTGGRKVAPAAVEAVLAGLDGVAAVCVVGVPDAEWGQAVTAVVVPAPSAGGPPDLRTVRDAVARTLGAASAPRHLVLTDAIPERGPGKPDRREVARRAAARVAGTTGDDGR